MRRAGGKLVSDNETSGDQVNDPASRPRIAPWLGLSVAACLVCSVGSGHAAEWEGWQTVPGTETPSGGRIEVRYKWTNDKSPEGNVLLLYQFRNGYATAVEMSCEVLTLRAGGREAKSSGGFKLASGEESKAGQFSGNWTYAKSIRGVGCKLGGEPKPQDKKLPGVDEIQFPGKKPPAASPKPGDKPAPPEAPALKIGVPTPVKLGIATTANGSIHASRDVPIANSGKAPLKIVSISLKASPDAANFKLSETLSGKTIAPGQRATFTVSYAPVRKGSHLGIVHIVTDDPSGPQDLGLFGATAP